MKPRQNENNELLVNIEPKREIEIGKELQISVTIPQEGKDGQEITELKVLINRYGENPSIIKQMEKTKEGNNSKYYTSVEFTSCGIYDFFFLFYEKGEEKAIKLSRETKKPFITYQYIEAPYWRILAVQNNFVVPQWAKDQIFYQIFVDRFYKSPNRNRERTEGRNYRKWGELPNWKKNQKGNFHNNDFFGGNLKGIQEKLEYLKSLHVGVIYLSPINKNLDRYDGYASINHLEIDPDIGDFKDLKELHAKANAMGMYLILDIAVNHCSNENPIFQEAYNNLKSPYRNWFYFDEKGNYKYWYNMFKDMPIFNQNNPDFQAYIYGENGMIDKFSKYVDGFRLDVAEEIQPFFLQGIRERANKNRPHLIIAEAWWPQGIDKFGKCIDSVTNYPFTNAILKYVAYGEYEQLKEQIKNLVESYPQDTVDIMLNSLDTHDMIRALTILAGKCMRKGEDRIWDIDKDPSPWHRNTPEGRRFFTEEFRQFEYENDVLEKDQYEHAKKLLKLAVMIQYFIEGNPCIFYGTEVGLHGYKDPFNRKCFPWDNIDTELLAFYQEIGKIRSHFCGQGCQTRFLHADTDLLVFERYKKENAVLVAVNRGNEARSIELPKRYRMAKEEFIVNNAKEIVLLPLSGIVKLIC